MSHQEIAALLQNAILQFEGVADQVILLPQPFFRRRSGDRGESKDYYPPKDDSSRLERRSFCGRMTLVDQVLWLKP